GSRGWTSTLDAEGGRVRQAVPGARPPVTPSAGHAGAAVQVGCCQSLHSLQVLGWSWGSIARGGGGRTSAAVDARPCHPRKYVESPGGTHLSSLVRQQLIIPIKQLGERHGSLQLAVWQSPC